MPRKCRVEPDRKCEYDHHSRKYDAKTCYYCQLNRIQLWQFNHNIRTIKNIEDSYQEQNNKQKTTDDSKSNPVFT